MVISEPVFIRLFRNGLKSSIHAQVKQKRRWKNTWDQAIRKAITAEANAALNLLSWVWKTDARCPQSYRSASKPTKNHTWDWSSFPFCPHKAQAMPSYCSKSTKTKRSRHDYQKGRRNKNCRNCNPCGSKPQSSTPASGVNMTKISA